MNPMLRAFVGTHVGLFRMTGGKLGTWGGTLLLLTTTGRKSGQRRTIPLRFIRDDEGNPVITASMGGAPQHPLWFENLRANPEVTFQIGAHEVRARAEIASPEVRSRLWEKLIAVAPGFIGYQKKTTRVIPMVILKAIPAASG
jgi:proline iminopeptidase